ncbi:hypothetical protein MRX96_031996 [Rhipicephalus microplus]
MFSTTPAQKRGTRCALLIPHAATTAARRASHLRDVTLRDSSASCPLSTAARFSDPPRQKALPDFVSAGTPDVPLRLARRVSTRKVPGALREHEKKKREREMGEGNHVTNLSSALSGLRLGSLYAAVNLHTLLHGPYLIVSPSFPPSSFLPTGNKFCACSLVP